MVMNFERAEIQERWQFQLNHICKVCTVGDDMPEGQEGDVRKGFIIDDFALFSLGLNDVVNLDGVPIENGVRDEAQAASLVSDFLVVPGGEFTLIGKEDATWKLVSIFILNTIVSSAPD